MMMMMMQVIIEDVLLNVMVQFFSCTKRQTTPSNSKIAIAFGAPDNDT